MEENDGTTPDPWLHHELQRQSEELRSILDSVPAYIWYKDAENRIIRANRLAAESMHMSPDEIEGRSTYDLFPAHAKQYHLDDLEVIRSGKPKAGIIEPLQIGGRDLWISTTKVPYRDATGHIVGVIVFAVDITDRVLAEDALRRAHDELGQRVRERTAELAQTAETLRAEIHQRKKAEDQIRRKDAELAHMQRVGTVESIAAELAHEINQPLAAIINFSRGLKLRLQQGGHELEASLNAVEQISRQAARAAQVVQRLRDFIGKRPLRRVPCRLGRVIESAAGLIETEARTRDIKVSVVLEPGLEEVGIDPVQIEQVILNLLRNAIDATNESPVRPPGEIAIHAGRRGTWIEVRVVDRGGGLPTADVEEIFQPFYTTKADGLGMGLAISRSIVAAHGGSLSATPNEGPGVTFTFTLPCE